MKRLVVLCSIGLLGLAPLATAAPAAHTPLTCIPTTANAKVVASAEGATSARVYFRSNIGAHEYYVEMLKGAEGFWAPLPLPSGETSTVTYRIVTRDAAGAESSTSPVTAPVNSTCVPFALTADEKPIASNLVIGQTADPTTALVGFLCDGVVNTITAAGQMQAYDECNRRGAAWWTPKKALLIGGGAVAIGAGAVIIADDDDDEPVSPVTPR